jgi:gliding motility-associated-like protein
MRSKLLVLALTSLFCLKVSLLRGQIITVSAATGTITGCVGSPSASPNLEQIVISASGLSAVITASASPDFELSLTAGGNYANSVSLPQAGGTVFIRSAATAAVGNVSGNISFSSPGASVSNVPVSASISALPVVNVVASQTVSSGNLFVPVNFTGTAPAYRWTNSNPAIGIAASGSGNIPSFTAVSPGATPITATFTVTPAPAGFIFTANFNSNTVSMVNTGNNTVTATIPVGNGPFFTAVSPNQREVYVSCNYGNEIDVLDALTGKITAKIQVGSQPFSMTNSQDGSLLYVANSGGSSVSVINTATHTVTATIPVGLQPYYVVLSPDGARLYVATFGERDGEGLIYIINTADNTVITSLATNSAPSGIVISPDGSRVYVADRASNSLIAVNTANNSVMAFIPVGNYPLAPVLNANGSKVYVPNMLSNNVTVINTATNSVITTIATGNYSGGGALSADGQLLYTTNRITQSISVINTANNTVIQTIPLSGVLGNPVISPDGSRLYITDVDSNVIHVFNTATNTFITDIPVGTNPLLINQSITSGSGCSGTPVTFTLTATPPVPAVTTAGSPSAVQTSYGIPSPSTSFTVSGANLTSVITVVPPAGFEVSTDKINFSGSVMVGGANNDGPFTIYLRLAGTSNVGTYGSNVLLSSNGAATVMVTMPNSAVTPSIINITGTSRKTYGDALTDVTFYYNTPGFTFNTAGLYNGNTFKSIHFAFGNGASATAQVGTYTNAVTLSDFQGDNGYLPANYTINYFPFDLAVLPAPLVITANNVSKPYGSTLTNVPASTNFNVSGIQNNETIGNVMISYGQGASATSPPGLYTGSVVPSDAAGGTFSAANYTITYQPGDLLVAAPPPPVITQTGQPAALETVYGTPSATTSFQVSATNLTAHLTITIPAGFEISSNGKTFVNNISFTPDALGTLTNTPVFIRLAQVTPAGSYTGNLTLNSTGAVSSNTALKGIVTPAPLTITGITTSKIYGSTLNASAGSTAFTSSGLQNAETVGFVTLTYGQGAASADQVKVYSASLVPSAATGGTFNAANYLITYLSADINVVPASLTITANNMNRAFAKQNPSFTATYTGFVNNEGPAQLTTLPTLLTNAVLTSPAGQYPIDVSGAAAQNYTISYVAGILTIYSDPQNIRIPNTFTPNGDGVNDVWNITDLQYYTNCTVDIYNRYGQQLYHSTGYGQAWDGTFNRRQLPFGTYYYIINLNDASQVKLSGYVAIIK